MEEEDDDYVVYGTPLPEIEDEITLRKKAARELEVRDEKGRRRFHGAFSGGFSAGYFNTVGSKEGWAPSSFASSRNKTADRIQRNPEDFMDAEDLGEFGIATRKIHTSYKFEDSLSLEAKKRKYNELNSVIPGEAPLRGIIKPVRDSIGIEILKKLGWKPGQGIGPRVKKADLKDKVYGCSLPGSSLEEEDDPYALSFTFAPKDTISETYKPKDNYFGLGYTGLSKQCILSAKTDKDNPTFTKSFLKKDKKKLAISGQAFGVGAFEDDDDDIYSKDDMSQYDFSDLEKDSDQPIKHGKRNVLKQKSDVIEGFHLASHPPLKVKYYPPPELPPDFIPTFSKLSTEQTHIENIQSSSRCYTSDERSLLLGEKNFQSFQLKTFSPAASESKYEKAMKSLNTKFSPSTATFKPFPNDSAKQKRYEDFLKLKDSGELHKLILPSTMTEWEKQQEFEEFNRSSVLFKPLSTALSSKFESRSHLSVEHEVIDAIEKAKKEKSQKVSSKKKLVGLKNRKTFDWFPSSLLCKRFNVPNPYPDSTPSGSTTHQSKSIFEHLTFSPTLENTAEKSTPVSSIPAKLEKTVPVEESLNTTAKNEGLNASVENLEKPEDTKFPYENEKPPMDFFKDIFENSSSEEEETAADTVKPGSPSNEQLQISKVDDVKANSAGNVSENPSKITATTKKSGFGVFANLDLDALNQRRISENKSDTKKSKEQQITINTYSEPQQIQSSINQTKEISEQVDLYGPELPPNYSENLHKSAHYPSKRHKVKHKHKHHKHKSKKKKKKTSHKSSDENSSDSESDINPLLILEKLKKIQKKM